MAKQEYHFPQRSSQQRFPIQVILSEKRSQDLPLLRNQQFELSALVAESRHFGKGHIRWRVTFDRWSLLFQQIQDFFRDACLVEDSALLLRV